MLLTSKGCLISEVRLFPYSSHLISLLTFARLCFHCGDCAMNMEVRRRSGRIPWNGIYRMSSCKTDRRPMDRWSWIFFVLTYVNGRVLPYTVSCHYDTDNFSKTPDKRHSQLSLQCCINTLRERQNCRHFADDIFKCIFLNENVWILFKISLKFVPKLQMNNIPALV